ncbi:FAD-dependent monooxygenase [Dyadobacter sp. CY261]|uniref:FAD-dependent monooxygenase n=1 Tax=Dyadobacter sp. CY261 TaxID=2907203 RepID=UPI001F1B0378|nr:FAD-dependent monooxygenase [Dyadobacter sp. CY261]MCF0069591.1 FAD-dependent monooxygenase [Dyadobacter sp. CY261]
MEVAIIGAGIGGLTTALALQKAHIPFRIYEGAPGLEPVGAGIIIAHNAMQALKAWGITDQIVGLGNRISVMNLTRPDLSNLSTNDLRKFEQKSGLHNIAIHRADLHRVLVDAVGADHIVLNKRLKTVGEAEDGFQLSFEDGTISQTNYLIGADGLRSRVRSALFENGQLRDAGQNCWRGVAHYELPDRYHHELNEAWGKGKRFGFVPLNDRQVYWYLLIDNDLAEAKSDVLPFLRDFHPLAAQLVEATPTSKWIISPIFDLKPMGKWSTGRACLIGDAAHATTPNLGQGACQAIEDAYVLGELLKRCSLEDAIRKYPSIRMAKANHIVDTSWRIGKVAHARNRFTIGLRNLIMKATPEWVNHKQLEKIFSIEIV